MREHPYYNIIVFQVESRGLILYGYGGPADNGTSSTVEKTDTDWIRLAKKWSIFNNIMTTFIQGLTEVTTDTADHY